MTDDATTRASRGESEGPASAALVYDCDSHIMEPADLWQRHLEPEFRDRAIRVELRDGVEHLIIAEQVVLSGVLAGLGGAGIPVTQLFGGGMRYADGCPPASREPAARVALLDAWGVDRGVLFPTIGILPFPTDDMALISAYCRAYNRWQTDFAYDAGGRVLPIATLNWRDVDAAVLELERCLALGFRGIFVPPELIDGRRPDHPDFDPIWRRCAEAGIPGCLHVIVRFGGAAVPFAGWHESAPGPVFSFALGATGQLIPAIAAMVVSGLFDRHPTLKVVSVEAGCGYAPYLMDRLDEKFEIFAPTQSLEHRPSDYFRRNLWFVAEPDERGIGNALELVGEDRILWGSDYPHIDSVLDAPDRIRRSVEGLAPAQRRRVMGDNARAVFGT
ncbi:MAG TPA: amidohydrolase family protein [Pseudomonadales bacterium]|nr:amidohydrolase family protein [Pseudomonadales bacterium]